MGRRQKRRQHRQTRGELCDRCRIFDGPVFTALDDRRDYGEVRKNSIGQVDGILYLVVTHTDRDERIRIISARPAKRSERQRYDETL